MSVYIVEIDTRKGDGNKTLGPFTTFKAAQAAIIEECGEWVEEHTEFDSNFNEGAIYTEEETILILERELK